MMRRNDDNPMTTLSRSERARWRMAVRQAERDHDAEQMETLRGMAASGSGITGLASTGSSVATDTVEMIIDGRRVRASRVHRPTLAALREALASIAALPLTAVTRYGPYWVLTFRTAAEPLVMLVDRITVLPDWGGGSGWVQMPTGPALSLAS